MTLRLRGSSTGRTLGKLYRAVPLDLVGPDLPAFTSGQTRRSPISRFCPPRPGSAIRGELSRTGSAPVNNSCQKRTIHLRWIHESVCNPYAHIDDLAFSPPGEEDSRSCGFRNLRFEQRGRPRCPALVGTARGAAHRGSGSAETRRRRGRAEPSEGALDPGLRSRRGRQPVLPGMRNETAAGEQKPLSLHCDCGQPPWRTGDTHQPHGPAPRA